MATINLVGVKTCDWVAILFVHGLLGAEALLERLWPDPRSRPSLRWLREQQHRKTLPCIRLGRRIYFDPLQVAEAIADRLTVWPKRSR